VRAKYSGGVALAGVVVNNHMIQANNRSVGLANRESSRSKPRAQPVFARRILQNHIRLCRESQVPSPALKSRAFAFGNIVCV
jgi:hypothetical protein